MKTRQKILLAFAAPVAVTAISSVIVFEAITTSLDTADRVRHTEEVIAGGNALISDNPPQVARVDEVVRLHQRWADEAAGPIIAARRTGGFEAASKIIATGVGKNLTDQIRGVVDQFI